MSKIVIGESHGKKVDIDLDILISTRMLIQANSGAGKSYLLRRLMEQLFGHIQVICIDPEGEFATLREKYGYVLVGKGGETPADVRSAAEVAEKLLQLKASAVCDLYEMKPPERHAWVKRFLDAMLNAPKNLWHPCVVIVDEAHIFCPENGAGESEAKGSMNDLTSRGRKRGFCAVWATQRLAKVDKDSTSLLQNRIVGGTFEDVDIKRAIDLLSVSSEDKREFTQQLRTLEPGFFYAFGRAISKERLLFKGGKVNTSHPTPGSAKHAAEPPPPPADIQKLLPQLADLPKQAEEKAQTVAALRKQVGELTRQLRSQPQAATTAPNPAAIERAEKQGRAAAEKELRPLLVERDRTISGLHKQIASIAAIVGKPLELPKPIPMAPVERPQFNPPMRPPVKAPVQRHESNGDSAGLSGPESRILNAIAWMNSIGVDSPQITAVAFLAGYTIGGGAFNNPKGALRSKGLVEYLPGERIRMTAEGEALAQVPSAPLDASELQRMVLERLPGPEQKILRALLENPEGLSNEELADAAGYAQGGGAFNNPKGRLRSLGLIDYRSGLVVPERLLFLEGN